jgi:hypothetical protein
MDNINRNLISKVFSYRTNDFNLRYGFDDETQKSSKQLQNAIAHQKTFLFKNNIHNGTSVYIDSNNVGFCYLATIMALAELGAIFKKDGDVVIGQDIDIEELYQFKSKDSVLTHNLTNKRSRRDTLLYNKVDHYTAIKTARERLHVYKGNTLIVTHPSIQYNIHTVLLPLMINNNVQISAVGVNDISQAKEKINFLLEYFGITQVFVYKEHLPYLNIGEDIKIFDYT